MFSIQDECNLLLLSLLTIGVDRRQFTAGVVDICAAGAVNTGDKLAAGVTPIEVNLRKDVIPGVVEKGGAP